MVDILKNEAKHIPFIVVVTILLYSITVFATTIFQAVDVDYDNTNSGIVADQVQGAVDELYQCSVNYKDFSTSISTPEGKITGTLATVAQTIIGAINEINGNFTNGVLNIMNGGTGGSTAAAARSALGMASTSDVPAFADSTGTSYGLSYSISSYGKVVTVRLYGTATSTIAVDSTILTLPSGKRPSNTIFWALFSDQNGDTHQDVIRLNVTTAGVVTNKHVISNGKKVFGSITFIAA